MPPKKRRALSSEAQITLFLHWLLTLLFAGAFVLVVVMLFKPLNLPGDRPAGRKLVLLISGLACTVTALAQRLPLQNVLLAVFVIAVLGGAVHALGAITGIPFGPFTFGEKYRAGNFQNPAVGRAGNLGAGGFEFARCGAAHPAPMAKDQCLWLLAHGHDGGADAAL